MRTYRILSTGACLENVGNCDRAKKDFAKFLYQAIPSYLNGWLTQEMACHLGLPARKVRDAFDHVINKWRSEPCCKPPKRDDWDSIGVGTELCNKEYGWIQAIDDTRRVRKDCKTETIYSVDGWGWKSLDQLKEKFWLVEK